MFTPPVQKGREEKVEIYTDQSIPLTTSKDFGSNRGSAPLGQSLVPDCSVVQVLYVSEFEP